MFQLLATFPCGSMCRLDRLVCSELGKSVGGSLGTLSGRERVAACHCNFLHCHYQSTASYRNLIPSNSMPLPSLHPPSHCRPMASALPKLGTAAISKATFPGAFCQDAALTKIKASDLPQVGGKEMQARECAALFEKLWKEETQQRAVAHAYTNKRTKELKSEHTGKYEQANVNLSELTRSRI